MISNTRNGVICTSTFLWCVRGCGPVPYWRKYRKTPARPHALFCARWLIPMRVIASSANVRWTQAAQLAFTKMFPSTVIHILLARIVMPTPVCTVTVITGIPFNADTWTNIHVITRVLFNPVPRSRPENSKYYLTGYWFD